MKTNNHNHNKVQLLLLRQFCSKSQSGLVILALFGLIQIW